MLLKTWVLLACAVIGSASLAQAATLSDVYALSLQNDLRLKAAQSAYLAGQESPALARARLLPNVTAQASVTHSRATTSTESSNPFAPVTENIIDGNGPGFSIALTQPVFNLAAWHDYRIGTLQARVAGVELEREKQALILRVSESYLQTITAGAKLAAARSTEDSLRLQLQAAKTKYDLGMARKSAYLQAQAAFDAAAADTVVAANTLSVAFDALQVITGAQLDALAALPEDLMALPPAPADFDAWHTAALQNNSELAIAQLKLEAAHQNALGRAAEHLPTVAASVSYADGVDHRSYELALPDRQTKHGASVAVTVTLPLYQGGAVAAGARAANARYSEQRDLRDGAERSIVQQAHSSYLNVISGVAAVNARKAAIASSQGALEFARKGYDEGVIDMLNVLDAERTLFRARQDYADALYSYLIAGLNLKRLAGSLSDSDVAELDRRLDRGRLVRDVQ